MQTLANLTASVIGRGLRAIPLAPAVICIVWATGGGCYAWAEDLVLTARSLQAAGQHMQAVTLLSSALKSAEQLKLTAGDRTVILAEMGGLYLELGRYIEAESHLRRSLAISDRGLRVPSPVRLKAVNDLVSVYIETRDYSRAQKLIERTFSQEGQLLDLHPLQRARALENLATVYYFRKRYNEAGTLLLDAIRLLDQQPDADRAGLRWLRSATCICSPANSPRESTATDRASAADWGNHLRARAPRAGARIDYRSRRLSINPPNC